MIQRDELPLELPSSRVVVEGWETWLFRDAIGAPLSYVDVHPGMGFVLAARGSAVSLSDLLAMVGCRLEDGPMLVGSEVLYHSEVRVGQEYELHAAITGLVSKTGRTLGAFDLLTHEYRLCLEGETVFVYRGEMVIPRRSA